MSEKIEPWETILRCYITTPGIGRVENEDCQRIRDLTQGYLKKIISSRDGTSTLYRDPEDNRLWDFYYPFTNMRWGKEMPVLIQVTEDYAAIKYSRRFFGEVRLEPWETALFGDWYYAEGHVVGNEPCIRVELLMRDRLIKLGHADGGWATLCKDPLDGRLWEHSYPFGYMQGGGPPSLIIMSREAAIKKYGEEVVNGEGLPATQ